MSHWYMITLVGEDQPGIVARITKTLFANGCNLGETSMMRLGGNFTIMMMTQFSGDAAALEKLLQPDAGAMDLRLHVDPIHGHLHQHLTPDVSITVFSGDRAGIVSEAVNTLTDAGLNILDLNSDVSGTTEKPIYIMQIDGQARQGMTKLEEAVKDIQAKGIDIRMSAIDTVVG